MESQYRGLKRIGEGRFRRVYRGEKVLEFRHGQGSYAYPRAIKIYKTVEHSPVGIPELEVLQSLIHPNIERLYHFGTTRGGRLFIETELIDGQPLLEQKFEKIGNERVTKRRITRTLSPREVVYVALRVAEGLEYLHSRGYVARDLSLQNIMVNADLSVVKISDLGNIKKRGEYIRKESRPTGETLLFGQDYLPPEIRANDGGMVDGSTDTYALGACLLYMFLSREGDTLDHQDINLSKLKPDSREEYERGIEERMGRIGFA